MRLFTLCLPFLALIIVTADTVDKSITAMWANDRKQTVLPETVEIFKRVSQIQNAQATKQQRFKQQFSVPEHKDRDTDLGL